MTVSVSTTSSSSGDATLITADRVLTGPAGAVADNGALLVESGVIRAVGSLRDVESVTGPGVRRLDCSGATVLPGLIDCHVHLCFDSGPDPIRNVAEADPEALATAMVERALHLLASGVTTVRDLGDRDALTIRLRDSVSLGSVRGPRIVAATTPLTSPGGHCGFLGGEVATDEEIRERVELNAAAGADLIKVMASGGALTPGGPRMWEAQFTEDQLRLIVAEAAGHGLPVAAHAHGTDTIGHCVAAGVRTIEHCSWRTAEGMVHDEETIRRMAKDGTYVCRCVSGDWRLFLRQLGPERAESMCRIIRGMHAAGVRFVAGTDAGVPGARFGDYAGMLEFFVSLGFTTAEVLDMATVHAADALGLPDTGSLAPGRRADILVVDGDPLTDLTALRRVRHVITPHTVL